MQNKLDRGDFECLISCKEEKGIYVEGESVTTKSISF